MSSFMQKLAKNWDGPWGGPPSGGSGGGGKRPSGGGSGGGNGSGKPPSGGEDWDEFMRKRQEQLRGVFGGGSGGGSDKKMFTFVALAALALWLGFTSWYTVKAEQQGVVVRFGEFTRTTPPGFHLKLPYPVEMVYTPEVTTVNKLEVGFNSGFGGQERSIPEESLMLTGDENIVDIHFVVQWKIDKADHYLFNVRAPETIMKAVAESAMREVVGQVKIMSLISEGTGRKQAADGTRALMQRMLNEYNSGIHIKAVNLLKADPPAAVLEAFRDVQSARADLETARNQAQAYSNDILPRARGKAEQMLQQAEAYRQEVMSRAEGEASRFSAVYEQYRQSPKVVKDRMYLEAMEDIYKDMNKVIISDKSTGVLPFLPLQELAPAAAKTIKSGGGQ